MESVAEKVVDKIETVEENDKRITNEKFSEHIGRRGMVLRSVLMSSPRRSSKTLNPGDRCIFKTRKSMTEHTCARSRSQSFRRKSPRPKQKIGHITNVLGPVTRSRARTSLCYKAFISWDKIKAGGRVGRPSSRSVTSQLMPAEAYYLSCLSGNALSPPLLFKRYRPHSLNQLANKVIIKYITSFTSSHHSDKSQRWLTCRNLRIRTRMARGNKNPSTATKQKRRYHEEWKSLVKTEES